MENTDSKTTPSLPPQERGAGGKLKKPPSRRLPPTPYARPQQNQVQRNRWLSKLVDPASRLIVGGASLIFPSFFSNKSQSVDHTLEEEDDQDKSHVEGEQNIGNDDSNLNLSCSVVMKTNVAGTSTVADRSRRNPGIDGQEEHQNVDTSNHDWLSEIEQLMKDKRFSRDEVNRLIEIIRLRATDLPDAEQERQCSSTNARDDGGPLDRSVTAGDLGESIVVHEHSRVLTEERHEDLNISTPLPQSTISRLQDDVGNSPIEIARAYMENRTSEVGFPSRSSVLKDEQMALHCDELASKPFAASPSIKPSTCWPGATVQDQHGYMTPQIQRGRFGLHNFPQTPYSRSIYSRSNSKSMQFQGNKNTYLTKKSMPPHQSQTPLHGWANSRGNVLDNDHGSVGPIRRARHKVFGETSSRRSALRSSLHDPYAGNFNVSESIFSSAKKKFEGGTNSSSIFGSKESKPQRSEVSVPTVPAHSSQMARKILEHLERNPPTPKDKSAELKQAISWKKPQSSDATTFMPRSFNDTPLLGGLDCSGKLDQVQKENSVNWNENGRGYLFRGPPRKTAVEANNAVNNNTSASDKKAGTTVSAEGDNTKPSHDFWKSQDSQLNNTHEDVSKSGSGLPSLQKKPPSHCPGNKPVLPNIFVNKPEQRWASSSDNSLGFTFPISASSSFLSEPPTPSIMPSSVVTSSQLPEDGSSVPSFSFGSKHASPALVFSFPSTSSAHPQDDAVDLKFSFGTDKRTRISFSSIGKNGICY